jgi:hypothetical protein
MCYNRAVRLAGGCDGLVRVFFGGRVSGKPGLLISDELRGFFADVADGLKGKFAREVICGVFGRLFEVGGPALGGVEKLGQDFTDVAMVGTVVVEVVVEFVGDGGKLLEEIVCVFFATGFARVSEEILDGLVARIEELDEDQNAIAGDIGGVAKLLDLSFRESALATLGMERQRKSEHNESEQEPTEHWF